MDNSNNQINKISSFNSLEDLYNSLHENSITASHTHDWIVDGGELDITATMNSLNITAAYTLDQDPLLYTLTEIQKRKERITDASDLDDLNAKEERCKQALISKIENDQSGKYSYNILQDEKQFNYLKKNFSELFNKAKEGALVYIDSTLQELNFPRSYEEFANSNNPIYDQLFDEIESYNELVRNVDKYYRAIPNRNNQPKKIFEKGRQETIAKVKKLLDFKKKLEKDSKQDTGTKVVPEDNTPAETAQPTQQSQQPEQKPIPTYVEPKAPAAIPGDAGTTPTTNPTGRITKTKKSKKVNKNETPATMDELYDAVNNLAQNQPAQTTKQETPVQKPSLQNVIDKSKTNTTTNTPATAVEPNEAQPSVDDIMFNGAYNRKLNFNAGKYFLLYQDNPEAFKKLTKEQKAEAEQDISENLNNISLESLFEFLRKTKKQFKPDSELYQNIVEHIIDKDQTGYNCVRLFKSGFDIKDKAYKEEALRKTITWAKKNPEDPTIAGRFLEMIQSLYTKLKDKFSKKTDTTSDETKDAESAENKEQELPKNLKEFEEQSVEDKADNTSKDNLDIKYFHGNNYAPEVKETDDEKLIEMYKVLDAVGADENTKSFLAYKQKHDNGYFQVFYKEFKEHPKTAITDLIDVMNNTEWKPEEPVINKLDTKDTETPKESKVDNNELLKIFKQDYKAQFNTYPDELIIKVLEMPEVTEEEKTKFLTAYNKDDATVTPEDMKVIYEFVSDISNFLSKQLPAYKEKVKKGRENDTRWMEYHKENQQRMQQNDEKAKLEQELRGELEGSNTTDSEKMAIYTVLHNSTIPQLQQFKELLKSNNPDDVVKNVLLKIHNKKQLAQATQSQQNTQNNQTAEPQIPETEHKAASVATMLFVKANFVKK